MIKLKINWNQNMKFSSENDNHTVVMDAKSPIGRGDGFTPKELVVMGIAGCSGMDVAAWMKKHKQIVEKFEISTEVETTSSGHPSVFTKALLTFQVWGAVEAQRLIEAVKLSQTQYCGVSAMLVKAFPIHYRIFLNDEEIGSGQSNFNN